MVNHEPEMNDELTQMQVRLIRQGIRNGLAVGLAGAVLCIVVMLPVLVLFSVPPEGVPDEVSMVALIVVSMVVPVMGLAVLGVGLYKLAPLYIEYRRARRAFMDEELFP